MPITLGGRLMLPAVALAAMTLAARAQDLPRWPIGEICASDSARAHCAALEQQARNAVAASWPFVPGDLRKQCIARQTVAEDRTWRVLATCLEGETGKQAWIATRSTPIDMQAYRAEVAARRAELAAETAARRQMADDARSRAEAEAQRIATEAEARRKAAEDEARRKAEETARQLAAEIEARRQAEEADARRKAEEDAQRAAAEAEARRVVEEAETKRRAEEDAKRAVAEAEARRRAEEDARRRAEAEELRRLQAETDARKRAEEDARRRTVEAEASRKAAEEARRQSEEAEARRREAEAARRDTAEAEAEARRKAEDEARRATLEAEARRKTDEDARRAAAEAEARRKEAEAESRRAVSRQADACQDVMGKTVGRGVILFGHDDANLDASSYPTLDQIARAAKICTRLSISVDGHTNNLGSVQYNQGLSERRAAAVVAYLKNAGVEPEKLAARGYGQTRPVAANSTADGLAKNRRIEFTVRPE